MIMFYEIVVMYLQFDSQIIIILCIEMKNKCHLVIDIKIKLSLRVREQTRVHIINQKIFWNDISKLIVIDF